MAQEKQLQVYAPQPVYVPDDDSSEKVLSPKKAVAYLADKYNISISDDTLRRMAHEGLQAVLLSPPSSKRLRLGFTVETLDKLAKGELFDIGKLHLRNRRRNCPHQVSDYPKTKVVTGESSSPTLKEGGEGSARVSKTRLRQMLGL